MLHFLRRLLHAAPTSSPVPPRRATPRPRLESLEGRECPAALIANSGGVLGITGSSLNDTVTVRINDATNLVTVQASDPFGTVTRFFPASSVNSISIATNGGGDTVNVGLDSDMTRARSVAVRLGDGNDRATLDFGLFKSHALSANLSVFVDGQASWADPAADDVIRADFGDVNAANLSCTLLAGGGNDNVQANLWGILRGTQAYFNLHGEAGRDTLRFYNDNGSWASSLLSVNLNGGSGQDNVSLFYDDNMVGQHVFRLNGGADEDTVFAEIHARSGSTGSLSLDVHADEGSDVGQATLDISPLARLTINRCVVD
jgi:spore coat protein U-like protein